MKLIRGSKGRLVFQMGKREERLLLQVLELYPRVPPAHLKLSKGRRLPDSEGNQKLLDEALAEQRAENKKQLQALLADPQRFAHTETGGRLSLSPAELEWVMQVLNDVRVGSWIRLGSPEQKEVELSERTVPDFTAMETAGYFEMRFLQALSGEA